MSICAVDGTPTGDAAQLCRACTADLEHALTELPALLDDADLALSRQTAQGRRHGGRSSEKALPYDVRASDVLGAARATLAGWVQVHHRDGEYVFRDGGPVCRSCAHGSCDAVRYPLRYLGEPWPRDTPQDMARWLLARLQRIRHHEAAAELATELRDTATALRRAVDGPAERWYAGPCGADLTSDQASGYGYANQSCDAELYARPKAAYVTCPRCKTRYDMAERRAWLLEHAEDRLMSAPDIARILDGFGTHVTAAMIRGWKHRGRVIPHAEDTCTGKAIPLYRIGDILDVLALDAAKAGAA